MDNEELNQQQIQDEQGLEQPDNEGTPQEESDGQPEFALDENGQLHWNTDEFDYLNNNEDSEEEHPQVEEDDDEQKEDNAEEQTYIVKVDGEEVEVTQDELLRGYMRQADYTRKTQMLANERQQIEQQYQPQEQNNIDYEEQFKNSNADLNAVAKRIAAQTLGLESEEDLSELDFDHITAVVEAKQALINQRNQILNRQQNITNLENQLRNEEPQYDEIMKSAEEAMSNLPYKDFKRLQVAYESGNPEPLRNFFHTLQKNYYSKAIQKVDKKKKQQVPIVESSSNTPIQRQTQRKRIDFRKLGSMSTDQKAKMLLDLGFVD